MSDLAQILQQILGAQQVPGIPNAQYVKPGQHQFDTPLPPQDELTFRAWLNQNKVPFNPDVGVTDYDMRGFWQALKNGDPLAHSAVNTTDNQMHYPDYWKTPYHESFSADSQWATPDAPQWKGEQLIDKTGKVVYETPKEPPT